MKKYYIKKITLSIGIVHAILIIAKMTMPLLFAKEFSENEFLIRGLLKLILLLGTLYILKREQLINWSYTIKNIILTLIVSLTLIYLSWHHTFNKISELKIKVSNYDHFSYAFNCLSTGLFEECFFRILTFAYVCKIVNQSAENNHFKQVLWTSFFFAIVHISNFLTGTMDIVSTVNQIMFAFLSGIFFQSIFFRFNNIFLVSILHALVNYNGMISQLLFKIENHSVEGSFFSEVTQTFITFTLVGVIIVLPVAYLSLKERHNFLLRE